MADTAVSFLLENLSQLVNDELRLLSGVEAKINSMRCELKFIQIFLNNSIGRRNDDLVKEVVNQIRDVAFKAQDVVDIYVANVAKHRRRNRLSQLFQMPKHAMVLHEVDDKIEEIKNRINEIYGNREIYGITQSESTGEEATVAAAGSLRERRRHVEEEHVVGLVSDQVIHQLTQSDSRCEVVSIVGMGGLGKTTLARKIYNNNHVKDLFPTRAWGYVSNEYRPREVLLSLLKCLLSTSEYNDMFRTDRHQDEANATSEEKLKMKLGESLKKKKYLVVLDDIWRTEVWDTVKDAFPDDNNGSKILITSRIKDVALYTGTRSPYYLQLLKEEESWQLFSKKVFGDEDCPSDLESLGRFIVKTCKGLPLAIVVLAGLVAMKEKSKREWSRIKNITWHLTPDRIEVMDILKLSYDSLPQRLKPCFLYFGIYPEDYEINARQLIQLWTAEGFIQTQEAGIPNALEPEDFADYYLDELVDRSLVQVASRRSDGGVKTCRIHDLLHDLCISESKSDKFLEVCREANINNLNDANPRRLSFHCKAEPYISFDKLCIRSLFFFEEEGGNPVDILKSLKLCRLIYCKARPLSHLPSNLKKLIHLRYLRVDTLVKDIPSSISCLWNLETLDIKYRATASKEIWKLKMLRHLYLRCDENGRLPVLPIVDNQINRNLQTLWLESNQSPMALLVENDIFPKLKKLVLKNYQQLPTLPSLHHLSNLKCLKVGWYAALPSNVNELPQNLNKITLAIGINDEWFLAIMNTLGLLTNLQILKLIGTLGYVDFSLDVGTGEFPQLQVFQMKQVRATRWRLEEGAMPHLRHLVLDECEYLSELPEQLWSLTTLRQVHVFKGNVELVRRLQNVELKNGCELILEGTFESDFEF